MILVTYLISTWNRKDALKRHLELLMLQTHRDWFEVIVCVDGSTDGTQEMLAGLGTNPKYVLRWFDTGNVDGATVAKSRNNGIRASRGEIIIMVDDDCLPHHQLIESYVANHEPWKVQSGYRSDHEDYLNKQLPVPIEPGVMSIWWEDWRSGKFGHFTTNNCCMSAIAARTPAKDGSIGFDERFEGYGHEDSEFGRRLGSIKYRLEFNPDAVVWHMNPECTPQQDFDWKEAEKIKSRALMKSIMAEPWPVYPGFSNITGMMSEKELQWLYLTARDMASIVEIGSWQGRSTHALLMGCSGTVYAVDHWDPEYIGIPNLSAQIIENNWKAFNSNLSRFTNLRIIKMTSLEAAKTFPDRSADMVFIDGDHAYGSVIADIEAWLPKSTRMICGHDFESQQHPGVVQAVEEKFGPVEYVETIWLKRLPEIQPEKDDEPPEIMPKNIKRPPLDRAIKQEEAETR